MVAERREADGGELFVLDEGAALWERRHERIAAHFGRVEVRAAETLSRRPARPR
jgi:hypothetical protein